MLRLFRLLSDNRGASAIEYALVASLISVAAIVSFNGLGSSVDNSFETIEGNLSDSM